jgi:glutamine amidotransferase
MANLRSVEKALQMVGGDTVITNDPDIISKSEKVVLPGVGAFCAAMENLNRSGLKDSVSLAITSGKPFLGICLGLQMLFSNSTEMGSSSGMGVLDGEVVRFFHDQNAAESANLKVPHMGWNSIVPESNSKLLSGVNCGDRVYFVHSYYPEPKDAGVVSATCDYGGDFCCAIERGNVAAVQFHPEKSGAIGLRILRNFVCW